MTPTTLTPDALLGRAAEMRAHGLSWDTVARKLKLDEEELQQLVHDAGPAYRRLLATARREVRGEAADEALVTLRRELRSDEDKARRGAADSILKLTMTLLRHRPKVR